jgi:hypothetical protein
MCHTKTPPIPGGALRVLPGPLAVPQRGPKSQVKSAHSGSFRAGLGAPEVRRSRRVKPAGRRTGRAPFSYGPGWPLRKFPSGLRTRRVRRADRRGVLSFAYFSLHKQRKVGPPRRAAPCLTHRATHPQGNERNALMIGVPLALTADVVEARAVPDRGLRSASPQSLSPTGTSLDRRRETGSVSSRLDQDELLPHDTPISDRSRPRRGRLPRPAAVSCAHVVPRP